MSIISFKSESTAGLGDEYHEEYDDLSKINTLNLPPASQSHFATFKNFIPDPSASFEDEFARLASSQDWVPSSQQFSQERTIAIREEIKTHYFPTLDPTQEENTEEEELQGYQALCNEVGIPPSDNIDGCKRRLKNTLVNIVDLIDARRTGKRVEIWDDFEAFREYTLRPKHRINKDEATGYLRSLLQHLKVPRNGRGRKSRKAKKDGFRVQKPRR